MTTDLDALEALAKVATPGPWIAGDPHPFVPGAQVKLYGPNWTPICIEESSERYVRPTRDADFIAATDPSTVLALIAELRQERERADKAERALLAVDDYRIADWQKLELERDEAEAALSRAEETIAAIRVARANHPECDKVPDGISCGWKRAVQDIDATLTEYEGQP